MASNVTEECQNAALLQEKEEGEISLEDVSSSEEGHTNSYPYNIQSPQCASCMSLQHCGMWCTSSSRMCHRRSQSRRDAVQGKENWHHIKDSACTGIKHTSSTLQEKNDDLVPISSDSDMEIIGLVDNSKHIVLHSASKSRSKVKRKKKRAHSSMLQLDDLVSPSSVDPTIIECMGPMPRDTLGTKESHMSRSHHRDMSPIHRNRSRVLSRSPPRRHRSPIRGHSFKRSRTPIDHARSPVSRRSPRRVRSPRRSPYRSPVRTVPRKTMETDQPPSNTYVDMYGNVTKLLKRVKHLDSIGVHSLQTTINRNKENASSLKEKLFNMMKELSDSNGNVTSYSKEKSSSQMKRTNDADDDEDLALLRQQALETKQKKSLKLAEPPKNENENKSTANDDDQDDKDMMKLRIIALRSAVLKKHQNRVRKGMKTGVNKKCSPSRSESPFSQSFIDSIPIPDEERENLSSPPHSPYSNENNCAEDIEKLPYSPTDKITQSTLLHTESVGNQSSDVTPKTFTEINTDPAFSNAHLKDKQESSEPSVPKTQMCTAETPLASTPYSPSDPIETPKYTELGNVYKLTPNAPDFNTSERATVAQDCYNACTDSDINSTSEIPYSPTDTPIYDPDLPQSLPQIKHSDLNESQRLSDLCDDEGQQNRTSAHLKPELLKECNGVKEVGSSIGTDSVRPCVGYAASSSDESISPNTTMVTVDDLPEADIDTSPRVNSVKHVPSIPSIPDDLSSEISNMAKEPLYMQAAPEITKDTNRIPTLITRALVPVPILKSNKQLQQPLPVRKQETHTEPAFKSAEMQPVAIDTSSNISKSNTLFKPIKLVPVAKKTQSVLPTPTAFNNCLNDDQKSETSEDQNNSLIETKNRSPPTLRDNSTVPQYKRKRRTKKSTKWKNANALTIMNRNNQGTVHVNAKSLRQDKVQVKSSEKIENIDEAMTESNALSEVQSNKETEKIDSEVSTTKSTKSTAQEADQTKEAEKRRQSVDEDEEALRAILLASLAKRSKPADVVTNVTTSATTKPTTSETNTLAPPRLPSETVTTTKIDTISRSSTEAAVPHLRESLNVSTSSGLKEILSSDVTLAPGLTASFQARKRHLPIVKGPPRKMTRKVSIPASTKVVNNAKKYQNTIVQRKLNQQKVASRYNIQKITDNDRLAGATNNEKKWMAPSKSLMVPEAQRIVINLESDTESDSESEKKKNQTPSLSNSTSAASRPPLMIPTTEFEKSVDQFLREARKKQESIAAKPPAIPNVALASPCLTKKSISPVVSTENEDPSLRTPLAVRHLPASQQEEYRRLKQQILEHEKLKLRRSAENTLAKQKSQTTAAASMTHPTSVSTTETHLNPQHNAPTNSYINLTKSFKDINSKTVRSINTSTPKSVNTERLSDKVVESNQAKNAVTNPNVRTPNETVFSLHNSHARALETSSSTGIVSQRINFDNTVPLDDTNKSNASLKILTKDELNRKFVQIHVDQDNNKRMMTMNNKAVSSLRTQLDKVSNSDIATSIYTDDGDANNLAQIRGSETILNEGTRDIDNTTIDSETSTELLSPVSQSIKSIDTFDTTGSTLTLSQYQAAKDECLNEVNNDENCDFKSDMILNNEHSIRNSWETIRQDIKQELNILINLPEEEQKRRLVNTEQKLVRKRYTILNDLAKMVGTLRQWDMERDFQTNLVAEVKMLREQLKVAENKLQEQRNLIKDMGPKVMIAHKKINDGRRECCKLSKICSILGTKVKGTDYMVPDVGAQLLIDGLKDVASHTRQLSKKKVPSLDIPDIYMPPSTAEYLHSQTVRTEAIQTDECLIQTDGNSTSPTVSQEDERKDSSCSNVEVDNSLQQPFTTTSDETPVESNKKDNKSDSSDKSNVNEYNESTTDLTPQLNDTNATTKRKECDNDVLRRRMQERVKNYVPGTGSAPVERAKEDVEHPPKKIIEPYVSILKHLEVPRKLYGKACERINRLLASRGNK